MLGKVLFYMSNATILTSYRELAEKWNGALKEVCLALGEQNENYAPSRLEELSRNRFKRSNCYVISGISGSGKTTFGKMLEYLSFRKLPTAVVRNRRPEEVQGLDYIFVNESTFRQWEKEGEFLFSHRTNGVFHGFPRSHLAVFKDCQGKFYLDKSIKSVYQLLPYIYTRSTLIYLLPPSFEELYHRISKREQKFSSGLSAMEIISRFEEEIEEFRQSINFPYTYFVNESPDSLLRLLSLV